SEITAEADVDDDSERVDEKSDEALDFTDEEEVTLLDMLGDGVLEGLVDKDAARVSEAVALGEEAMGEDVGLAVGDRAAEGESGGVGAGENEGVGDNDRDMQNVRAT
ncbi:MAG: hypothetical protein WCS09_22940, partial [Pseudomonadota bacterium]